MASRDKSKVRDPGKQSWFRSVLVRMGLAMPPATTSAAPESAAPETAAPESAAAAPVQPPAVPAPPPAPAAPAYPTAAEPGAAMTPPATPSPGIVPVSMAAAQAAPQQPAAPPAPPAPAPGSGEVVEGFEDDAQARAAAAAAGIAIGSTAEVPPAAAAAAAVAAAAVPARRGMFGRKPKAAQPPKADKPPKVSRRAARKAAAAQDADGSAPPRKRRLRAMWTTVTSPANRSRLIVWAGALVLGMAAFVVVALGVTSTYWFCANGCHKVQDDTIIAYNRSAHSRISCMACHMPVNADPITFVLHKAKALGELYATITDQFELPLNPESEVAKTMPAEQCTQCHTDNRPITPTRGILIDHKAHAARGITCTTCHNRVAHVEDFKLTLAKNRKHEDWMKMDSCFRCHSLAKGAKGPGGFSAPGDCSVCHPKDFPLKPLNHRLGDFGKDHPIVVKAKGKAYCSMCHNEKRFCNGCHGTEIPHPANFGKSHGAEFKAIVAKNPDRVKVCMRCHGGTKLGGTAFCNACHHKGANPNRSWLVQHPEQVRKQGPVACLLTCHNPVFCATCHVRSGTRPGP